MYFLGDFLVLSDKKVTNSQLAYEKQYNKKKEKRKTSNLISQLTLITRYRRY